MPIEKQCPCGEKLLVKPYLVHRKKYCSKKCLYKYRVHPSGMKYVLKKVNPTSFKKGMVPWNKGVPMSLDTKKVISELHAGKRFSPATEFKKGQFAGAKNAKWKGDSVGYFALHGWANRYINKSHICSNCGKQGKTELANKSHEYKRDINDWIELCKICHCKYDKSTWGEATKRFNLPK